MTYEVMIRKKNGEPEWQRDAILPGLITDHVFDLITCEVVEHQLDLCKLCDVQGARCHVFEVVCDPETGEDEYNRKMCPILFHDVVHPTWRVRDVV